MSNSRLGRCAIPAVLLCALILVSSLGLPTFAEPKIKLIPDSYNFGLVQEGKRIQKSFLVANEGDATLILKKVVAWCGCTQAKLSHKKLAPGETSTLDVVFDSSGYRGQTTKAAYIYSNDPKQNRVKVTLSGQVRDISSTEITPEGLRQKLILVIDLRSPEEYRSEHVLGAINIPRSTLSQFKSRLPKNVPIVVYSEEGQAGKRAADMLKSSGFQNVKNLFGGFQHWKRKLGGEFVRSVL